VNAEEKFVSEYRWRFNRLARAVRELVEKEPFNLRGVHPERAAILTFKILQHDPSVLHRFTRDVRGRQHLRGYRIVRVELGRLLSTDRGAFVPEAPSSFPTRKAMRATLVPSVLARLRGWLHQMLPVRP
jgi:hypothetical protein